MMLGERLKEYRKKKGWNQEDLAKYSGYSRSSIINWETEKRAPRTVDIERLAQTLGVSPHDLMSSNNAHQDYDSPIRLQTLPAEETTAGFAYWGRVLDEAQKVAKCGNLQEISLIVPMLKMAYETLIAVQNNKQEGIVDTLSGV